MGRIIAVDFDGTLVKCAYPEIGEANETVIESVRSAKESGSRIILWTCRTGKNLEAAIKWCADKGLGFDAVNENLPEVIAKYGGDTRKIYAHEYWDDRAVKI